jgi:hypothetical protein
MEVSGQLHASAALPPRKEPPGTHWIWGWVGPRAVLNAVAKRKIPSPRRESNPRSPIVQPVAQRYADWAMTALWFRKGCAICDLVSCFQWNYRPAGSHKLPLPLTHLLCFSVHPLHQFRVNNLHNVCKSPACHLGNQAHPRRERYNSPHTFFYPPPAARVLLWDKGGSFWSIIRASSFSPIFLRRDTRTHMGHPIQVLSALMKKKYI